MTTAPFRHTLWRHAGTLLTATGVGHTLTFVIHGHAAAVDIARAGAFNAVVGHDDRLLVWYGGILEGAVMIVLGLFMTSWVRAVGRPVPRYVGWTTLGLGVSVVVLQPLAGTWLVVLVGLLALSGPRARTAPEER